MHLFTIIAFASLFWHAEGPNDWPKLVTGTWQTALVVLGQLPLLAVLASLAGARTRHLFKRHPNAPQIAQHFHHKTTFILRIILTIGFLFATLTTPWPDWFRFDQVAPELQVFADHIALTPFFAGAIILWIVAFPIERAARLEDPVIIQASPQAGTQETQPPWKLRTYLDFNIRHHLLVVAIPLTFILFGSNVVRGRDDAIKDFFGAWWAPDVLLGAVAGCVFLFAPILLVKIWHTSPIQQGPLRIKLENICNRINLRVKDILVWNTDNLMINAAVMGIIPQVRYVLLSDALLDTMSDEQIEAVFGHEAGHVRHNHIPHFLLFAFVGWLIVAGIMELLAQLSLTTDGPQLSLLTIQTVGIVATLIIWGLGFGWLSRRFERQADTFGAFCVTPTADNCKTPCSLHLDNESCGTGLQPVHPSPLQQRQSTPICATGANIFASALARVATLNGIPREEKSWRHSSIAYRVKFLRTLAADPKRAARFTAIIKRAKRTLLIAAIVGIVASLAYWKYAPQPALLRIQTGVPTTNGVSPS